MNWWLIAIILFFSFVAFTWWMKRDVLKMVFWSAFDQYGDRKKLPFGKKRSK